MQALATHLKRKNLKMLEAQLSLPKIPQQVANQFTKTAIKLKKSKPSVKYVSETTFSPQEQHINDQIRLILHKQSDSKYHQYLKKEPVNENQVKKQRNNLPRIRENTTVMLKKQHLQLDESRPSVNVRKSKSVSAKFDLESIFKDKNSFIENYFASINSKLLKR